METLQGLEPETSQNFFFSEPVSGRMNVNNLVAVAAVVLSSAAMAQTYSGQYPYGEYHAAASVNGGTTYGDDYRRVAHDDCNAPQVQPQPVAVQYQPQYQYTQSAGYYRQVWVPQTCRQYGYHRVCNGGYYRSEWVAAPVLVRPRVVVETRWGTHPGRFGRRGYR